LHGPATRKVAEAEPGEIVAIGKLEGARAGELLSTDGRARSARLTAASRRPGYALAVASRDQKDDVRLAGALAKLVEEDRGLDLMHLPDTREVLLRGQGEAHLRTTVERLKRRFGVEVATARPKTPYRETI